MTRNPSSTEELQTHPVNFVPNKHFDDVVACCVGLQFIQPVFKLCKSVALRDVIYCQNHANREKESEGISDTSIAHKYLPFINFTGHCSCLMVVDLQ